MSIPMSRAAKSEKRRIHIALSLDDPLQRETWSILSQAKNKTSAVCEAVCGYYKQKSLEDTLRSVLRDEMKHIAVASVTQIMENDERSETTVDDPILDFLQSLQNE